MNDDIKPVDINSELQSSPPSSDPTPTPPSSTPSTQFPQPSVMGTPPPKGSRKKIYAITITILVVILVAIGGGAAYALWYNNPEKVVADAVGNIIKSPSSVSSAVFVSKTKSGDKLTVNFSTQSNNPKLAGSLDAKINVDTANFKINFGGAGMVTESGDFYFKIDNAKEVVGRLLVTDYGKLYVTSPTLRKALENFAAKIDGKWIKVDTQDVASMLDSSGYKKERQCYKKALTNFYDKKDQQNQVIDAYNKNKFITVNNTNGSENINGVSSKSYDISLNVKKSYDFSDAAKKTDAIKSINKCAMGSTNLESYSRPIPQEIKKSQNEIDRAKLKLWISKWDHNLTGIDALYNGSDGTSNNFTMKTNFKAKPQLKNPQSSLSLTDLQQEINKIFTAAMSEPSIYQGAQAKARETKRKTDAALAAKQAQLSQLQ